MRTLICSSDKDLWITVHVHPDCPTPPIAGLQNYATSSRSNLFINIGNYFCQIFVCKKWLTLSSLKHTRIRSGCEKLINGLTGYCIMLFFYSCTVRGVVVCGGGGGCVLYHLLWSGQLRKRRLDRVPATKKSYKNTK